MHLALALGQSRWAAMPWHLSRPAFCCITSGPCLSRCFFSNNNNKKSGNIFAAWDFIGARSMLGSYTRGWKQWGVGIAGLLTSWFFLFFSLCLYLLWQSLEEGNWGMKKETHMKKVLRAELSGTCGRTLESWGYFFCPLSYTAFEACQNVESSLLFYIVCLSFWHL